MSVVIVNVIMLSVVAPFQHSLMFVVKVRSLSKLWKIFKWFAQVGFALSCTRLARDKHSSL
jgi:hypothetical protein